MNEMRNQRMQRRRPAGGDRRNVAARPHQNGSGNASRNHARYLVLAREATLAGDTIEAENCYQHAEHYFRVMRESETGGRK
ncbi:MAG: DUF4167 domain-containing protein [Hyphomicrobiaceae bacterium]|jgi:hypothetical protein